MNILQCQLCGKIYTNTKGLGSHLKVHKIGLRQHYVKYFKQKTEGICKECGKETTWNRDKNKYRVFCSPICASRNSESCAKRKQTCLDKYGHECYMRSEEGAQKTQNTMSERYGGEGLSHPCITNKKIKTNIERYGVEYVSQCETIKEKVRSTNIKKYGVPYGLQLPEIQEKRRKTFFQKHNCYFPMQDPIFSKNITDKIDYKEQRRKSIETCRKHYGVDYPTQNKEIFQRQQKRLFKIKEYILPSGAIVFRRGYEPQFLDYVFSSETLNEEDIIQYPDPISYINQKGNKSIYYPDFHIPKLNLIVEIKSRYTLKLDINVDLKATACIAAGYRYIRIVDNNFTEFDNLVHYRQPL